MQELVVGDGEGVGGRLLHGDRHGLGPGHVYALTHLETVDNRGVGGVQQSARVGRPIRSDEGHDPVGRGPTGDGHGRHSLPGSRSTRQSPGWRRDQRLLRAVDRGLARGLHPHADAIVVGGRHGVANLDLLEPRRIGRHVQGHHIALLPSNRHCAAGVVNGLNSALDRDLARRFSGLGCRDGRR